MDNVTNAKSVPKVSFLRSSGPGMDTTIPLPMSPPWLSAADSAPNNDDSGEDGGDGDYRHSNTSTQPRSSNSNDEVAYTSAPTITRESVNSILTASASSIGKRVRAGSVLWDRVKAPTMVSRVPRSPQLGRKADRWKPNLVGGNLAAAIGHGAHLRVPVRQSTRRKSFFDVVNDAANEENKSSFSGDDSSGEHQGVVTNCVSVLESLTEHLWAAEKAAGSASPPGVHTVQTCDAAMALSPIGRLRWCIYQLEHMEHHHHKGSSVDTINKLFQSKVSDMGEQGDEEDSRISAFIQQTFLGIRHKPAAAAAAVVNAWQNQTGRSSSEPAPLDVEHEHGQRLSLDTTGLAPDQGIGAVKRSLSLRGTKQPPRARTLGSRRAGARKGGSGGGTYIHHNTIDRRSSDGDNAKLANEAGMDWIARRWKTIADQHSQDFDSDSKKKTKTKESRKVEAGRLVFSADAERMLSSIGMWGLDLFTLDTMTSGRPLVAIGLRSIEKFQLYTKLKIDPLVCAKFFTAVENGYAKYPDVPYHNHLHGADVLHTTFALLDNPALNGVFTDLEIFAALLAAAAHDIGHPGVNNSFMINTSHDTAVMYNDASVLENFHTATVFRLIGQDGYNVLGSLSDADAKQVRRLMIQMILGTDMAKHVTHLAEFRDCMTLRVEDVARAKEDAQVAAEHIPDADADPEPDAEAGAGGRGGGGGGGGGVRPAAGAPHALPPMEEKHRATLLEAIVHLSDLSGATKPWELCRVWSARVLKEFIDQGYKEQALGLPVEPLNDGSKTNVGRGQKGFISYVVAPLWEIWEDFINAGKPEGTSCEPMDLLNTNLDKWEEIISAGDVTGHKFVADVLEIPIEEVLGDFGAASPAAAGSARSESTVAAKAGSVAGGRIGSSTTTGGGAGAVFDGSLVEEEKEGKEPLQVSGDEAVVHDKNDSCVECV